MFGMPQGFFCFVFNEGSVLLVSVRDQMLLLPLAHKKGYPTLNKTSLQQTVLNATDLQAVSCQYGLHQQDGKTVEEVKI